MEWGSVFLGNAIFNESELLQPIRRKRVAEEKERERVGKRELGFPMEQRRPSERERAKRKLYRETGSQALSKMGISESNKKRKDVQRNNSILEEKEFSFVFFSFQSKFTKNHNFLSIIVKKKKKKSHSNTREREAIINRLCVSVKWRAGPARTDLSLSLSTCKFLRRPPPFVCKCCWIENKRSCGSSSAGVYNSTASHSLSKVGRYIWLVRL